ncbi:hypothetical protein KTU01_31450 [Kocuria turfanensis]|uniref:AB hydrolase-1 domain-containing protein n=1 Tax=Kocuria turfanensis TaxID=388357 RepID=A0A512IH36_9MICC|nr:hypothetical protein KTU01_31450 [Kocuria turfanensis]
MTTTTSSSSSAPTVVLVHGAFAESASWNGVITELHARGHRVLAVANPLRGLGEDAACLRSIIDTIPGPVVVAGHSYGGSVMSEAADDAPGVTALVYIASFQLEPGESTAELAGRFPGGELGGALEPHPLPGGREISDLYIRPELFREVFAADVDPTTAAQMAATQRPIVASALEDRATKAAWQTIPSWSLVTMQDLAIPVRSMRFMSERAGRQPVSDSSWGSTRVELPGTVERSLQRARSRAWSEVGAHRTSGVVDGVNRQLVKIWRPRWRRPSSHSPTCSASTAATRWMIAPREGKIPTASVWRRTWWSLSAGLFDEIRARTSFAEVVTGTRSAENASTTYSEFGCVNPRRSRRPSGSMRPAARCRGEAMARQREDGGASRPSAGTA